MIQNRKTGVMQSSPFKKITQLFLIALTTSLLFAGWRSLQIYPAANSMFLKTTIRSSVSDTAQLYYDTGKGLSEAESERSSLSGDNVYHDYYFRIPSTYIHNMRFDPLMSHGTVIIREMQIVNGLNNVLQSIDVDRLQAINQIEKIYYHDHELIVLTAKDSNDAQILMSISADLNPQSVKLFIGRSLFHRIYKEFLVVFFISLFLTCFWYYRHRVELTIQNSEIIRKSISFGKRLYIIHLLILVIFMYASFYLSFTDYYIDWDMQRYLVQVQICQCGSGSFSYMHNLINTWIFLGAKFVRLFYGELDTLLSVKILTMLVAWGSSTLLYLCIYRLTRNFLLAIMGGAAWFLIPGNTFLILTLEDNVWANLFNILYIFLVLILTGHISSENNTFSRRIGYSVIIGLCLSIGINIHQQLVPLVYLFPVVVWISHRFTAMQSSIITCFMLSGYLIGSLSQNYATFHQFAVTGIFQRLWHQPYTGEGFRTLWYFSSGKSPGEWIDLILVGLNRSFLSNVISTPKVFSILICFALLGFFLHVFRKGKRNGFWKNETNVILMVIFSLIFIHIPHSLFFEPWIVERWDATFPGLIMIVSYMVYVCITLIQSYRKYIFEFKTDIALTIICFAIFLFSLGNAKIEINKIVFDHQHLQSIVSLHQITSFIKNGPIALDNYSYIFLDPILQEYDNQALMSYYYPSANIITLNENLDILYTSDHFHHIDVHNKKNIKDIAFSGDAKIFAMDRPKNWLNKHYPEFLKRHEVSQIN